VHLDLVVEDEKVIEARPSIGFIHRGLEKLVEKKDYIEFVYVAERICGICSFIHSQTYCQAIESIMNIPVPPRALYLRTIWGELSRLHSHLLWLGLMADAIGFESLFMHSWRVRETRAQHHRSHRRRPRDRRIVQNRRRSPRYRRRGGQGRPLTDFDIIEKEMQRDHQSLPKRSIRKGSPVRRGRSEPADAYDYGCVGPTLRASGVETTCAGCTAMPRLTISQVTPITRPEGDSYARCAVRCEELFQSVALSASHAENARRRNCGQSLRHPKGEIIARTEQPRGEVVYYLKADGTKNLQRFRIRTPTFANLPAMLHLLKGCDLADVPVLVLTIDPCISCTER
jgi:ech hydrogenase subunit E